MCGIAGLIGDIHPDDARRAVDAMVDAQFHRGPDAGGSLVIEKNQLVVALGARRLAILDTSEAGDQPMVDERTGNVLVYNGEIYNFADLARRLGLDKTALRGRSDTEVLLHAYAMWGTEVLEQLIGMYGFALWDESKRRLLLARDRLGIKPLYVAQTRGVVVFASEVRALLASGLIERRLDARGLESCLTYGAVQGPLTMVEGVRSLPPAHYMAVSSADGAQPRRYWKPPFCRAGSAVDDPDVAAQRIRPVVERVLGRQLVSDVPLGLFLSGGIDSSSLAAAAADTSPDLRTFSINFREQEFAEGAFARDVADRLGLKHEEIELTERDLLRMLPDALAALDQPTHDGVNVFVVSRAAREAGVTVALGGHGGDELFGGYSTFSRILALRAWRESFGPLRGAVSFGASHAAQWSARLAASKRVRLLAAGGDPFPVYRALRAVFGAPSLTSLLAARSGDLVDGLPAEEVARIQEDVAGLHPVDQISHLELTLYLGNTLLRDGDFMSMANSIEVRVPLLDDELVELVCSLPGSLKLDPRVPKHLLVRALKDRLPVETYSRPKRGFSFPWKHWLHGDLRSTVAEVLDTSHAGEQLGLRSRAVQNVWRGFDRGTRDISWTMVWTLYTVIDWCRRHGIGA